MRFFDRLANGWKLAKMSLSTINENRTLLLFPVFSTIALIFILVSFFGGGFLLVGDNIEALMADESINQTLGYAAVFTYYLINFFVVVFFNSALVHCTLKILNGEQTSVSDGINFAISRLGQIFSWAIVSATVGTLLHALSETGKFGEIAASLVGGAWSILTFFVVPVIIYEEKGFYEAIKSSTNIVKEKWGESLAANISFGLFQFLGILCSIAIGGFLAAVHPILGVIVGGTLLILSMIVFSAAQTVFVAAVYNHVKGMPTGRFEGNTLDGIFIQK